MAAATFVGHTTPLVGTHTHPVYSEDRCGYVGLGELELGERVRTAEGWATVEAMARWWGVATVHNLEVEAQHRFLAGAAGVVSHNAGGGGGSCFGESCGGPGQRGKPGSYRPDEGLPRHPRTGEPVPDPNAIGPHTQIGTRSGRSGDYTQAREFDADGKPVRDVDFTDHGRPDAHPNPHQHRYVDNPTGGTPSRGGPEELQPW